MAKYRFSLEKVLDWRSEAEEQAQLKVHELTEEKKQEEIKLERLLNENLKLKSARIFDGKVEEMRQQNLYSELMDQKIIQQKLIVNQMEAKVEEAKQELLEVHKEKKVLEKLKEKEQASFMDHEKKIEQNQLDEMAVLHFGRSIY